MYRRTSKRGMRTTYPRSLAGKTQRKNFVGDLVIWRKLSTYVNIGQVTRACLTLRPFTPRSVYFMSVYLLEGWWKKF